MPTVSPRATPPDGSRRRLAIAFWGAIALCAVATVLLAVVGTLRSPAPAPEAAAPAAPAPVEFASEQLQRLFGGALDTAGQVMVPNVEAALDRIYAPVYDAIPVYADFHYSVLGEYTELSEAAFGTMSEGLNERLYAGFADRFATEAAKLDTQFAAAFREALGAGVQAELTVDGQILPLGRMSEAAITDALGRARVTVPVAGLAVALTGSKALAAITAAIGKKIAGKVAVKAAAKATAKGTSIAGGAGAGALACSWAGPGAVLCAAVGGAAMWFAADALIVNLDEYFNRDEFEAELRLLVDEDKAAKHAALTDGLAEKVVAMSESFTMQDLATGSPD